MKYRIIRLSIIVCGFFCLIPLESKGEIVDDLGRQFSDDVIPKRLLSLAPSNTELIAKLGLLSRMVGRTSFCDFPPQVNNIPTVAGFNSVDLERVASVKPDMAFAIRGNDSESLKALKSLGIPVFSLDIQSLSQLTYGIRRLGVLLHVSDKADSVATVLDERVQRVRSISAEFVKRPKVLWGIGDDMLYTAGYGSIIDDVITTAGGFNVGRGAEGVWPQISVETVMLWAPDIILTTEIEDGSEGLSVEIERLRSTPGWDKVPAIIEGRVLYIEADLLLRPGPRLIDALEEISVFINDF